MGIVLLALVLWLVPLPLPFHISLSGGKCGDGEHTEQEKRCAEQMDICLTVTGAVKDFIVEKGSDNKYGARPLRRAIQSRIEDALANEILEGKIKRGDHVQVRLHKEEILFEVKN